MSFLSSRLAVCVQALCCKKISTQVNENGRCEMSSFSLLGAYMQCIRVLNINLKKNYNEKCESGRINQANRFVVVTKAWNCIFLLYTHFSFSFVYFIDDFFIILGIS